MLACVCCSRLGSTLIRGPVCSVLMETSHVTLSQSGSHWSQLSTTLHRKLLPVCHVLYVDCYYLSFTVFMSTVWQTLLEVAFVVDNAVDQINDKSDPLKFIHNQMRVKCFAFIIKSRSARTHLRKIWLHGQIFVSHAHEACDVSISIASYSKCPIIATDWGIMGYNDVIVCVTVINLTNTFFFIDLVWQI